jgi:uncharacterized protein (DUF1501 family)
MLYFCFGHSFLIYLLQPINNQGLALAFQDMNTELGKFINEMKRQGIWEDTAIVLGSEFGRSVAANSNGGTDHGWAG